MKKQSQSTPHLARLAGWRARGWRHAPTRVRWRHAHARHWRAVDAGMKLPTGITKTAVALQEVVAHRCVNWMEKENCISLKAWILFQAGLTSPGTIAGSPHWPPWWSSTSHPGSIARSSSTVGWSSSHWTITSRSRPWSKKARSRAHHVGWAIHGAARASPIAPSHVEWRAHLIWTRASGQKSHHLLQLIQVLIWNTVDRLASLWKTWIYEWFNCFNTRMIRNIFGATFWTKEMTLSSS
jgi:hypothetical protein